jgi:hypothetical protein
VSPNPKVKIWDGCYDKSLKGFITSDSFSHPAKMALGLCERIIDHCLARGWIRRGEVVGDPFNGVCTVGLVASYRGLRYVGVELEPKFVGLSRANINLHRGRLEQLGFPVPEVLEGDSRQFHKWVYSQLVLSSPPYADSIDRPSGIDPDKVKKPGGPNGNTYQDIYGTTSGQIGRLKSGDVEAVVTIPPFASTTQVTSNPGDMTAGRATWAGGVNSAARVKQDYVEPRTEGQIAQLKPGDVQAVISSPPYAVISAGAGGLNTKPAKHAGQQSGRSATAASQDTDQRYGQTEGQIAALKGGSVDSVVKNQKYENDMGMVGGIFRGRGVHNMVSGQSKKGQDPGGGAGRGNNNRPKGKGTSGIDPSLSAKGGNVGRSALLEETISKQMAWEDKWVLGSTIQPSRGEPVFSESHIPNADTEKSQGVGGDRKSKNATSGKADVQHETANLSDVGLGKNGKIHSRTLKSETRKSGKRTEINGETYWQAMRRVYASCFIALKPGGYIILVVKDYCKAGKRVPLCDDTFRLLQHVGFEPIERIHAMLVKETKHADMFVGETTIKTSRKSFFRRLAEAKGSPEINYEEVLICRKPANP